MHEKILPEAFQSFATLPDQLQFPPNHGARSHWLEIGNWKSLLTLHFDLLNKLSLSHHERCSLPDDTVIAIGSWVVTTGASNLARCLKVNRRLRSVLDRSLEELAIWWAWVRDMKLYEENRLGFDCASVDIVADIPLESEEGDEQILFSQLRMDKVWRLLQRFPNTFLRIESHCWTAAPPVVAERFSVARGMVVVRLLHDQFIDTDLGSSAEERLVHTPRGRQIAKVAESSQYPYSSVAFLGKGWIELYICHGEDLEMPERPDFHHGHHHDPVDEEASDHIYT